MGGITEADVDHLRIWFWDRLDRNRNTHVDSRDLAVDGGDGMDSGTRSSAAGFTGARAQAGTAASAELRPGGRSLNVGRARTLLEFGLAGRYQPLAGKKVLFEECLVAEKNRRNKPLTMFARMGGRPLAARPGSRAFSQIEI